MTQFVERRKTPRVACVLPSAIVDLDNADEEKAGFAAIKDISAGGLKLFVRELLPPGHKGSLSIYPRPNTTLGITVTPAWIVPRESDKGYYMGVRFVDIKDDVLQELQKIPTR